jgi:hypothetical protein
MGEWWPESRKVECRNAENVGAHVSRRRSEAHLHVPVSGELCDVRGAPEVIRQAEKGAFGPPFLRLSPAAPYRTAAPSRRPHAWKPASGDSERTGRRPAVRQLAVAAQPLSPQRHGYGITLSQDRPRSSVTSSLVCTLIRGHAGTIVHRGVFRSGDHQIVGRQHQLSAMGGSSSSRTW